MRKTKKITEYTEEEFLALLEQIFVENVAETDDLLDELIEHFEEISEHPDALISSTTQK